MKTIALFVLVAFVAALTNGQPRRSHPKQAMMITGGFYGNENGPRGSMSAYASRDNSSEEEQDAVEDDQAVETEAAAEDEQQQQQDEVSTTVKPKKVSAKRKPAVKPQEEEEEQVHHGSRNDFPGYSSFFPIYFGGAGGAQRNGGEGYRPGTVAIANSYSTGKGGIASSHATSFGNPDIEALLRQFNSRRNSKADN
ncbi:PREDICTED: uncharacterized protein LOC108566819 [Nicrophorus vespilloides]|uniref:Uncharacterized protein LOC108566819 n=1 Tax=Nicrophorus vespilloides TaxID=110193 RepID=A0ABM1N6C2_NICVS|nr:PREDICTED: uncharacterized protein LOC108566819 [Nicrophorus vespilloides]